MLEDVIHRRRKVASHPHIDRQVGHAHSADIPEHIAHSSRFDTAPQCVRNFEQVSDAVQKSRSTNRPDRNRCRTDVLFPEGLRAPITVAIWIVIFLDLNRYSVFPAWCGKKCRVANAIRPSLKLRGGQGRDARKNPSGHAIQPLPLGVGGRLARLLEQSNQIKQRVRREFLLGHHR